MGFTDVDGPTGHRHEVILTSKPLFPLGQSRYSVNLRAPSGLFYRSGAEVLFASYFVGIVGVASIRSKIPWGVLSDKIGREVTYTIGIACCLFHIRIIFLIVFISSLDSLNGTSATGI
jgi:MFS family permease